LKRLFSTASPQPAPTPPDPKAEIAVLEAAHQKSVLNRLTKATFYDENREAWGVRLPDGRVLYRPTHFEIITLWYEEDARSHAPEIKPCITAVQAQGPGKTRPQKLHGGRPGRAVDAIDPRTGEIRHRFETVAAAGEAGFDRRSIHLVLAGEYRTHGGFLWRYREAAPLKPTEKPAVPSQKTIGSR
jgi:hypothetical protein